MKSYVTKTITLRNCSVLQNLLTFAAKVQINYPKIEGSLPKESNKLPKILTIHCKIQI